VIITVATVLIAAASSFHLVQVDTYLIAWVADKVTSVSAYIPAKAMAQGKLYVDRNHVS